MLRLCNVSKNNSYLCSTLNTKNMITLISRNYGNSKDVMLSVRVKNNDLNTAVALGVSVSPERWRAIADTIKQAKKAYRRDTSIFIEDPLSSKLWTLVKILMNNDKVGTLTQQLIKNKVREILHSGEMDAIVEAHKSLAAKLTARKETKPNFINFVAQYINDLKTGKRLRYRGTTRVSQFYINNFTALFSHLVEYQDDHHTILDWEDVTLGFLNKFKSHLLSKQLSTNTVVVYLSRLRTILRDAKKLHYTANDDFDYTDWYPERVDVDNIYVTSERIMQLYNAPLGDMGWIYEQIDKMPLNDAEKADEKSFYKSKRHKEALCNARDMFVVGCLTGQRHSDYSRITTDMYYTLGNRIFVHLKQKKTGAEVYIPLRQEIDAILKRRGGKMPQIGRAKYTAFIRRCGQLLGWTEPVTIHINRGEMTYTKQFPFYQLIKTHTCRRSFATNAYRAGVPLSAIMAVTGHSSEDMLRKYLKLSNKERALFAAEELDKMDAM